MKRLFYILMLVAGVSLQACDSNEEPTVLEDVEVIGSAFRLDEAGEVSLQFAVTPAEANVAEVVLANGGDAFDITDVRPNGQGKWTVVLKVTDFSRIASGNTVTLRIAQEGGQSKDADFNIEDPFSIEGRFGLSNPRAFNYYGIETDHQDATCLPVIVTAGNEADLAEIGANDIKVIDGVTNQKVGAEYFIVEPMQNDVVGFVLKTDPDRLADLKSVVPTFDTLNLGVVLTAGNGRVATLQLHSQICAPQGAPVEDDRLTLAKADLDNPDYENTIAVDVTYSLRHIGVVNLDSNVEIEEIGLLDDNGQPVEETSFIPLFNTDNDGKMICGFGVYGSNEYSLNPGTYTYVSRFHVYTPVGNVRYQSVCADLRFKVVVR